MLSANHHGAHTAYGPGRFIIFATNESPGPWVSVYPDSDKIGVSPGIHETTALNSLRLPRSGAVDYWYGEGTADPPFSAQVEREPTGVPSLPVVNTLTARLSDPAAEAPAGFGVRAASLGPALGGGGLGATVVELDPGEGSAPYHYNHGREAWMLILAGAPTLRHPDGKDVLQAGDVVCFTEGPGGAQRLINHGHHVARAVFLATKGLPANVCYPDSGTWALRNGPDDTGITLRETDAIGYWDR